jgi:RimJ/RimL family protein N-acetyltransferase
MSLPVPDPPLSDGVVVLRPPDERDLPAIGRALTDPDIVRAFGASGQSAEELLELNRRRWRNDEAATFAICDTAGVCCGHVFVNLAPSRRATIGYWLLPEARRRGLATRSVRLLSAWALRTLDIARLGLLTEEWNRDSQRVAERAGFHREGVLRAWTEVDGRRVDNVCFSLLAQDLE